FKETRRYRTFLQQQILQSGPRSVVQLVVLVVGVIARALRDNKEVEVILQIGADAAKIVDWLDPDRLEMISGTNARLHQQFRRADRARRHDDFTRRTHGPRIAAVPWHVF